MVQNAVCPLQLQQQELGHREPQQNLGSELKTNSTESSSLLVLFFFSFNCPYFFGTPGGSNTPLLLLSLLAHWFCPFLTFFFSLSAPLHHSYWLARLLFEEHAWRAINACFGLEGQSTSLVVLLESLIGVEKSFCPLLLEQLWRKSDFKTK